MHANAVAKLMGSYPVVVPPGPGLLCAEGDLVADFREEFARTFIRTADQADSAEIVSILHELGQEAQSWLERENIDSDSQSVDYSVDMRYYRQGYEIPVSLEIAALEKQGIELLTESFNKLHEQFYGYRMPAECEIVNLRAVGVGKVPHPRMPEADESSGPDASAAVVDEHKVYFEGDWMPTKIYDRSKLAAGNCIPGPAIIAEYDSTTVVLSGFTAEVDKHLNILINPNQAE